MRSKAKQLLAALFAGTAMVTVAHADDCSWRPDRAVTYIIPWGAGGSTDVNSRFLAAELEKRLGVPVNAVNRTGGNGVVGHSAIATARPDGYTIGSATVEITTMHHLGLTQLNQDNITPIGMVDMSPAGFFVGRNSPFESIGEVLDHVREHPGSLTGSGTSQGGIWHLALAGLLSARDLEPNAIRWVPSEGAAPALQELIAGGVDVATPALTEGMALAEAGEIRPLAVMSADRVQAMPSVPTLEREIDTSWALSAFILVAGPEGLPEEIACSYERAVTEIFESTEWEEFKRSRGGQAWLNFSRANLPDFLNETSRDLGETMRAIGIVR